MNPLTLFFLLICFLLASAALAGMLTPTRPRRTRRPNSRYHNDTMEVDVESGSASGDHARPSPTSPGYVQRTPGSAQRRRNREYNARSRARRRVSMEETVWRNEDNPDMPATHNCGQRSYTCPHCGAQLWEAEKKNSMICCRKGKATSILKPIFSVMCRPIWKLFNYHDLPENDSDHRKGKYLHKFMRHLNNLFSMASSTTYSNRREGFSFLSLHGALYHFVGPPVAEAPKFAQLYVIDNEYEQLQQRINAMNAQEDQPMRELIEDLQKLLSENNQLVVDFVKAADVPPTDIAHYEVVFKASGTIDKRRYNPARTTEVAGFMPGGENAQHQQMERQVQRRGRGRGRDGRTDRAAGEDRRARDFAVRAQETPGGSGNIVSVPHTHPLFDPLHFVLFHPLGEAGWHPNMRDASNPEYEVTMRPKLQKYKNLQISY